MLASMIGMALFHRERTGEGQEIHLPMMETILSFTLVEHSVARHAGRAGEGPGLSADADAASPPLSDQGRLHQRNRPQRRPVGQAVRGDGRSAPDRRSAVQLGSGRAANIDAVYATLTEGMKQRTTEEWLAELRPADIPCGKANGLDDLFAEPYLTETGYFESHEHPVEGNVVIPAIPARFSKSPPNVHRPWPQLGQHTREVLAEAGYSDEEIDEITAAR